MKKTNGITFKKFMNDKAWWPKDSFYEDEKIFVNGVEQDSSTFDSDSLNDSDEVKLLGGVFVFDDGSYFNLEGRFSKWLKKQSLRYFLVACDCSKVEEFQELIKKSGGKLI